MDKQFRISLLSIIDSVFAIIESVAGYAVHSLASVADSFHMFNDILSLVVALWAVKAAKSGTSPTFSYGLQRAEILGALVNAVFLLALCVTICLEAIQRFIDPPEITNPVLILVVGFFGLVSNFVGLVSFHEHGHSHGGGHSHGDHEDLMAHGNSHGHSHGNNSHSDSRSNGINSLSPESVLAAREEQSLRSNHLSYGATQQGGSGHNHSHSHSYNAATEASDASSSGSRTANAHEEHNHTRPRAQKQSRSMNMEGVFLHVLGDALGNIGVIITALFIWKTDFSWRFYCDPVVSSFITAVIFSTALPSCLRASKVLLQATPNSVNCAEVAQDIQSLPGVEEIHDSHIWQLSEDQSVATLHVTIDGPPSNFGKLAATIQECLAGYGIPSITIQPEFADDPNHTNGANGTPICQTKGSFINSSSA